MLQALQKLLADIYDVPLRHDVGEFLLTDRAELPQAARDSGTDEQVLVAEDDDTLWVHVYLEPALLARLERVRAIADELRAAEMGAASRDVARKEVRR